MILDSTTLTKAQKCPRIYILEQTESRGKWDPKALFDSCLRAGIGTASMSAAEVTFRQKATNPGLLTKHDPWTTAGDYCAMFHTIGEALGRLELPKLVSPAPQEVGKILWQPLSFVNKAQYCMTRFVTVERFDDSSLWRELHGWGVFGDMAATGMDLELFMIEIGSIHDGRRHSPWCRAFKHPAIHNYFKFKPRDGKLSGNWKPYWYADTSRQDPKIWVDLMEKDGLNLIHRRAIPALKPDARGQFEQQLQTAARRLAALPKDFRAVEMHKANCDWPTECPWQHKCYGLPGLPDPLVIYGSKSLAI